MAALDATSTVPVLNVTSTVTRTQCDTDGINTGTVPGYSTSTWYSSTVLVPAKELHVLQVLVLQYVY